MESEVRHYQLDLFRSLKTTEVPVRIQGKARRRVYAEPFDKSAVHEGYLKFINKPWRLVWLDEGRPELFPYKSTNACDGICRIERLELGDGVMLFVCEDIDENPGQSTTNTIESIAFQLCKRFRVKPEKLILIQYYPGSKTMNVEWQLVHFSKRSLRAGFAGPSWHPIAEADWRRLGYSPRKRPIRGMNRSSLLKANRQPRS
jgi:hypothetical protein